MVYRIWGLGLGVSGYQEIGLQPCDIGFGA